jgi:hypothetical protein
MATPAVGADVSLDDRAGPSAEIDAAAAALVSIWSIAILGRCFADFSPAAYLMQQPII